MSEKQSEYVTGEDVLGELMDKLAYAFTDGGWGCEAEKAALREYVTAQLADAHEVAESLRHVIDAKEQVIEAKQARIEALESDLRELQA